jgi:RimJ/RimL family protein N-acetyltransferase
MPGPPFRSGDIIELRPIETDDVDFLQRLVNDARVRETVRTAVPMNRRQERAWVDSLGEQDGCHLLVCDDGEPVGVTSFEDPNEVWGTAQVGFMIAPEAWNSGYATDALSELCGYAFEERRFNKLWAMVFETNPASKRVVEKIGFTEEGVLREEAFVGGEHIDVHRYGLLAAEWGQE